MVEKGVGMTAQTTKRVDCEGQEHDAGRQEGLEIGGRVDVGFVLQLSAKCLEMDLGKWCGVSGRSGARLAGAGSHSDVDG